MAKIAIVVGGIRTKVTKDQAERIAELEAAKAAAKVARDANPCQETREAYSAAWNAAAEYVGAVAPMKRGGFACRAGKRQHAEMNAMANRRR